MGNFSGKGIGQKSISNFIVANGEFGQAIGAGTLQDVPTSGEETVDNLLLEDGCNYLLETGSFILLESSS